MTSCIRCGASIGDFDAGGDMICQNCESSGHGGGGTVPCQRCGMYLPPHELRMHNSRLYCAYCIMDVQDEERRGKGGGRGGVGGEGGRIPGYCERCGRETEVLYSVLGKRLCSSCRSSGSAGGAAPGAPSVLSLIVEKMAVALGVRQRPRAIPVLPQGKIALQEKIAKEPAQHHQHTEKFSLKDRKMVDNEEGELGAVEPLADEHRKERKPSDDSKKSFFSRHSGEKKQ